MGGVGMAGMPYPPKCVLWEDISARLVQQRLLHPLTFRAFRGRTLRTLTFCEFREFRGRTPRTLTFRACVPWEDTHCLYTRPSST